MSQTDPLLAHFLAMARNNAWSNHRRLLGACEAFDAAAFAAPRTSFFPSLKATLNHLHAVDLYYLDALEEAGLGSAVFAAAPVFDTPAALRMAQSATDQRLIAFCARLTPADPTRWVMTDRGEHSRTRERIRAILSHLFLHQVHHRGQAHAMLAGTHVAPPQLDEFFSTLTGTRASVRLALCLSKIRSEVSGPCVVIPSR